ncbi:aminotransferase class IV [Azospirillum sp. HJ39]|uniref:aminotransferase class IV n=1 Tax=Azospirillum sp. HJ39 TaxID=3159496 RepID=UPI0035563894
MDPHGRISEATIWNLAFWDGEAVVWPQAALLPGVTMQIIRRRLGALGIAQREEPIAPARAIDMKGAAVMNSWTPGVPVSALDSMSVPPITDIHRNPSGGLWAACGREPPVDI